MAPVQSKLSQPGITGQRKRKPSTRITDENFVGAESNAVTKRLKLSAANPTTQAKTVKQRPRQASVEDIEDEDSIPVNNPPKNPNTLLEAVDGNEDGIEIEDDPAPALEDTKPYGDDDDEDDEDDDEEPEHEKPVETAKAQRGQSQKNIVQTCLTYFSH